MQGLATEKASQQLIGKQFQDARLEKKRIDYVFVTFSYNSLFNLE
jgi:hypothetical protein